MTFFPPATRLSFVSPSDTSKLLSISPGWYFIQIITAISMSRLNEIQTLTNITFTTLHLVYPGCYSFYLIEKQLITLQRYKELYVYPFPQLYNQPSRHPLSENESPRCKVKSIPNWQPHDSTISYKSFSNNIYIVNSTCSSLLPDDRIEYLTSYSGLQIRNRYNTGFLQSGSQSGTIENGLFTSPHPIFNLGIHGENQLISIIDTGVDYNHAFFKDPSIEYKRGILINTTMKTHRKIEKYYNFANAGDGDNGHGTHCGGILAGESYLNDSGLIMYSGMAPKARLVVGDVGFGPRDLDGEFDQFELFNLFDSDGVSICSNSWGFDANEETRIDTMIYDYIGYLHQEMLLVFAAGNEARTPPYFYTINSPGDSKNLLSVGGLSPTKMQGIENTNQWTIEINGVRYKSVYAGRGENPLRTTKGNPMKRLINLTIIDLSEVRHDLSMENKIVFIDDRVKNKDLFCLTFSDQNNRKPPAAVIHFTNDYSKCSAVTFKFPIFELDKSIKGEINLASTASIYEYEPESWQGMRLADYSSKGPSPLGLCKPDVVVPGTSYSSSGLKKSLTTDDLSIKSGTSMATPAAAGTCSLIRQYFYDGFYPYRTKNSSKSFVPSSYLIRGALINSATPFKNDNYGPNIETGFGLPNISSCLLDPLRIVKKTIMKANEKHRYTINLSSNDSPLRVTLAYIDPPLSLSSTMPLFADIDLLVISPSGQLFIGNERPNNQTEMANTIERVIVKKEKVEIGTYTIILLSNNFSDPDLDSVNYSLIINGPFDHFDFEANKEDPQVDKEDFSCEFPCLNNGKCGERGICVCDSDHAGFDCSIEYEKIPLNEKNTFTFIPNQNQHYKVPLGSIVDRTNISISIKLNTNDKYASLLLYASDMKFSSISDANVIPVQIMAKSSPTINLTVLPKENEVENDNFYIYLTLRIVSAYNFDVELLMETVDFPSETPLPSQTEIPYETIFEPRLPHPSETEEIVPPSATTISKEPLIPPVSSIPLSTSIPSSIFVPSSTSIPSSVFVPSSTSIPSSVFVPSSTSIPSYVFVPSSTSIPSYVYSDHANVDNLATHVTSIKGLSKISFLLSFAMIALCIALALLLIMIYIQKKRKNEIDQFYAREEEPKLTIVEKDPEV